MRLVFNCSRVQIPAQEILNGYFSHLCVPKMFGMLGKDQTKTKKRPGMVKFKNTVAWTLGSSDDKCPWDAYLDHSAIQEGHLENVLRNVQIFFSSKVSVKPSFVFAAKSFSSKWWRFDSKQKRLMKIENSKPLTFPRMGDVTNNSIDSPWNEFPFDGRGFKLTMTGWNGEKLC